MTAKILAFAGSARQDSFNKKLINIAVSIIKQQKYDITFIDLAYYPMPIYDGDQEEQSGLPENAIKLRDIFLSHDAFLIASPEYNSSISPLLKNTIDWVSRPHENEPSLAAFKNKIAGLLSASPGGFGGMRGLVHVRSILSNIGVHVVPGQYALSHAYQKINQENELTDENDFKNLSNVIIKFLDSASKLKM